VLLWLSVTILSLFGLELLILFCIERTVFLRNPLYVLDAVVVASALTIELYMYATHANQELAAISGLLIVSRSWRFVRIGHAIYMVNKKNEETHVLHDPLTPSSRLGASHKGPASHRQPHATPMVTIHASPVSPTDAHRPRSFETSPVRSVQAVLAAAQQQAGAAELRLARLLWARGVQTYEAQPDGSMRPTGPLADLFGAEARDDGTVALSQERVGIHYQHLEKPAWEFADGRILAANATPLLGASEADVPWLAVELQPNQYGYSLLLRIETRAGQPSSRTPAEMGSRHGAGYETLYACLALPA